MGQRNLEFRKVNAAKMGRSAVTRARSEIPLHVKLVGGFRLCF